MIFLLLGVSYDGQLYSSSLNYEFWELTVEFWRFGNKLIHFPSVFIRKTALTLEQPPGMNKIQAPGLDCSGNSKNSRKST